MMTLPVRTAVRGQAGLGFDLAIALAILQLFRLPIRGGILQSDAPYQQVSSHIS
jgi:hypothetical protein